MASLGARWAIAPKALARNASIEATAVRTVTGDFATYFNSSCPIMCSTGTQNMETRQQCSGMHRDNYGVHRGQRAHLLVSSCRAEKIKLDSAAVGQTDVLVKMLASPITRYDLATIRGFSGEQAGKTAGNEGVGIVEHAGSAAGLKQGDVVVACRPGVGK